MGINGPNCHFDIKLELDMIKAPVSLLDWDLIFVDFEHLHFNEVEWFPSLRWWRRFFSD